MLRPLTCLLLAAGPAAASLALPQAPGEAPVATALEQGGEDVRVYNDHVTFLASPFLEGRLPGTRGMEIAREYVQHYLEEAGLQPPFAGPDGPGTSWTQPFALGGTWRAIEERLTLEGGEAFTPRTDFSTPGYGGSGECRGELVFVGYSIDPEEGDDLDYRTYPPDTDLTGKVAVVLRFEPLDEDGRSRFTGRRWTAHAGFNRKFEAIAKRGAAAILLINTPGAADPRVSSLTHAGRGTEPIVDVPVLQLTGEAGARLLAGCGEDLLELRKRADAEGFVQPLGCEVSLGSQLELERVMAANVGGLLPGRGRLADQVVVVGAHLDHLGMGDFSSRDSANAGRKLHPGADDNASGVAGILMIAARMKRDYDALPEGTPARSVLFLALDAEEMGLLGAHHYVDEPILPIENHALMLNFDMIGRIENRRLSVSGLGTASNLEAVVQPALEATELELVTQAGVPPNSDHYAFYQKDVPVLFGIIADFHDDYHTPRDVTWKLNRVDAVKAMSLFHHFALLAALHGEPLEFRRAPRGQRPSSRNAAGTPADARRRPAVTLGVRPGATGPGLVGVVLDAVTEGGAADAAGLRSGDRLTSWNGEALADLAALEQRLLAAADGDEVTLGVVRGDETLEVQVTLKAR